MSGAAASASFHGAHFARPGLVERPLLASCPELICDRCRSAVQAGSAESAERNSAGDLGRREPRVLSYSRRYTVIRERVRCCPAASRAAGAQPGVVLDPFLGAGTVGLVAERHGRDWVGIEINPAYAKLA